MNSEDLILVKRMIDDAIKPLQERIDALEARLQGELDALQEQVDGRASDEHYHDDYASAEHVERADDSLDHRLNSLRNDLDNLDYRVNEVDRKVDNVGRGGRGW